MLGADTARRLGQLEANGKQRPDHTALGKHLLCQWTNRDKQGS